MHLGTANALCHTMKKIYSILMLLLAFNLSASGAMTNDQALVKVSWIKKAFNCLAWDELVAVSQSPSDICARVKDRVVYAADDVDSMKTAPETWEDGRGDCEDFANCIVSLCKAKGFDAWIEVYFEGNNSNGHAVAMGKWNGRLWISSNGNFKFVDTNENACVVVAVEMGWHRGQMMFERWAGNVDPERSISFSGAKPIRN